MCKRRGVRVVIGPVATTCATAWLSHAWGVLDEFARGAPGDCFTPEVREIFEGYLASWERCARDAAPRDGLFLWEAELAPEELEYHLHALQRVVTALTECRARTGLPLVREDGDDFYRAMLHGVLTALETAGPSHAEFAQHLGAFWPGRISIA